MFPITEDIKIEEKEVKDFENLRSFLFDFEKGEFCLTDGKVSGCIGIDAVKIWVAKMLKTAKFKFKIYENFDYGTTLAELVTSPYDYEFIIMEIEREVKEALLKNKAIKGSGNYIFTRENRGIRCEFILYTIYGEAEVRYSWK